MTPDPDLTPSDVLIIGAALIYAKGWAQGVFQTREGCLCPLGALGVASCGSAVVINDTRSGVSLLAAHIGEPFIAPWNDNPSRTMPEVVSAMLSAAGGA